MKRHDVTERPILFSGPMVRALLAGTKTQTRRALRVQPSSHHWESLPGYELKRSQVVTINDRNAVKFCHSIPQNPQMDTALDWLLCLYGWPGATLWVRENGWERPDRTPKMMREGADTWEPYYFDADGLSEQDVADFKAWGFKRRPSIHMPRWASRITLEITDVRVERLQDISRGDAMAEGCPFPNMAAGPDPRQWYADLWDQINGPCSWSINPWVWVIEFRRLEK